MCLYLTWVCVDKCYINCLTHARVAFLLVINSWLVLVDWEGLVRSLANSSCPVKVSEVRGRTGGRVTILKKPGEVPSLIAHVGNQTTSPPPPPPPPQYPLLIYCYARAMAKERKKRMTARHRGTVTSLLTEVNGLVGAEVLYLNLHNSH